MFKGCLVALVTPMGADGQVDYAAYERLIDWHLESKTDGLVILGTTGEAATVTAVERENLIRLAVDRVSGRIPVIVGSGANSTQVACDLTYQAKQLGANAALLVTPYYNKPTQEGLYQHFTAIAEKVDIPQILYNVPSRTAVDLENDTVIRLAKHKRIVALKDATGDLRRVEILKPTGLALLSGDDASAAEFVLAGGQGTVSVAANVAPRKIRQLMAHALSGDVSTTHRFNESLQDLYTALFLETNPIPTKWALQQMGRIQSGIRLPLTPMSAQYSSRINAVLAKLEILL